MAATYTFDVFCTLDGYGSYNSDGDWGGTGASRVRKFLDRCLALYGESWSTGQPCTCESPSLARPWFCSRPSA